MRNEMGPAAQPSRACALAARTLRVSPRAARLWTVRAWRPLAMRRSMWRARAAAAATARAPSRAQRRRPCSHRRRHSRTSRRERASRAGLSRRRVRQARPRPRTRRTERCATKGARKCTRGHGRAWPMTTCMHPSDQARTRTHATTCTTPLRHMPPTLSDGGRSLSSRRARLRPCRPARARARKRKWRRRLRPRRRAER